MYKIKHLVYKNWEKKYNRNYKNQISSNLMYNFLYILSTNSQSIQLNLDLHLIKAVNEQFFLLNLYNEIN